MTNSWLPSIIFFACLTFLYKPVFDGTYYGMALSVRPSIGKLFLVWPVTFKVLGLGSSYLVTKVHLGVRMCRELKVGHCDLLLKCY